ncbi:protein of unknown function [Pseudobutyrivibrio sp. YE44]|uniref:DUF5085 family protein n=1 Tax=Pseudobutyrivibrio sp. YE44 TaxID=1520802 RepID=UPI00087EA778|nr:DUF5085 family protein [Pseudobutyrivibrio sp. YE44]SDB40145.1 protein of unknown function [Pseudobutyrivibrio sp. YE44]
MNTKYIYKHDKMAYRHVYSKSYLCRYDMFGDAMEDFTRTMSIIGAVQNGNMFYSIEEVTFEGVALIQIFMPAKEYVDYDDEDTTYSSYFYLDEMLSKIIEKPEQAEASWAAITMYQESKGEHKKSSFYHEIHTRKNNKPYVLLKTK